MTSRATLCASLAFLGLATCCLGAGGEAASMRLLGEQYGTGSPLEPTAGGVPSAAHLAAQLTLKSRAFTVGDKLILAVDLQNRCRASAFIFHQGNVRFTDAQGKELSPSVSLMFESGAVRQVRDQLLRTKGKYYESLHTADNVVQARCEESFLMELKAGSYRSGQISLRYYAAGAGPAGSPTVVVPIPLGGS